MLKIIICYWLCIIKYNCLKFSKDFAWGTATAAYQIEGAWNEDGKGLNIWDTFTQIEGRIQNNDNGEIADDFYHRYNDDIKAMQNLGLKHFRMSFLVKSITTRKNR